MITVGLIRRLADCLECLADLTRVVVELTSLGWECAIPALRVQPSWDVVCCLNLTGFHAGCGGP